MVDRSASTPVERLCRLYDDRMTETGGDLSPEDLRELKAMAAIYDLDTDRSPAEVWRDVRAVVTRQAPRPEGDAPAAAGDPLTVMVVEDDAEAAADLTELLTDAGHSVVGPFHNAAAADAAAASVKDRQLDSGVARRRERSAQLSEVVLVGKRRILGEPVGHQQLRGGAPGFAPVAAVVGPVLGLITINIIIF